MAEEVAFVFFVTVALIFKVANAVFIKIRFDLSSTGF